MPSLFRRKPAEPADTAPADAQPAPEATPRPKGYTPSKKELGVATPKRTSAGRRVGAPAPANRREAYKAMRERRREERAEAAAGMRAGDERYLLARDRGPERALVRDIVDSRRTAGTYFFVGAFVVIVGSGSWMPPAVQLAATMLWTLLALAVIVDSVLISRRIKALIRERFPKTTQRMGSLYLYGIMRGLTFRRMRVPKPRMELGDRV
ncbi:MAG TPA: DUF3043 domain-containing protein [Actinoplanes sp.]|nr:DUF3043 domain-containing protein [Actinoplanes sp.]